MKRIICLLVMVFALHTTGNACDCNITSIAKEVSRADDIFIGKVIAVKNWYVIFKIESYFKGFKLSNIIMVQLGSNNCSYRFNLGKTYIVYAYFIQNLEGIKSKILMTSVCTNTRVYNYADVIELKKFASEKKFN